MDGRVSVSWQEKMGSSWSDLIKVIISLLGQSLAILIDHHKTPFPELRSSRCSTTLQLCADVTSDLLDHLLEGEPRELAHTLTLWWLL